MLHYFNPTCALLCFIICVYFFIFFNPTKFCTEMVMPYCSDGVSDMFPVVPWDFDVYSAECQKQWKATPRAQWIPLQFGAKNITAASNIIFRWELFRGLGRSTQILSANMCQTFFFSKTESRNLKQSWNMRVYNRTQTGSQSAKISTQ